jgi:hypothetical protein
MKKLIVTALVAFSLLAIAPLAASAQDATDTPQTMPPAVSQGPLAPYDSANPDFGRLGS